MHPNVGLIRRARGAAAGRVAVGGALAGALGLAALSGAGVAPAAGASRSPRAGRTTTLTVASLAAGDWSVVELGLSKGYFAQQGLKLSFVPMNSLPQEIPLMVSGHLDVGYGGDLAALEAVGHGIKLNIIGALERDVQRPQGSAAEIVVRRSSGISSFKQLTGKTVAVNALGTPFEFWAKAAIDAAGGDSAKTSFIAIPFTAQAHALASGQVDAISTGQPFASEAVAGGGRNLGDPFMKAAGTKSPVYTYWLATPSFVSTHRSALAGFMTAMNKAYAFANSHPSVARHFMAEVTKLPLSTVNADLPLPLWSGTVVRQTIAVDNSILVHYHAIPAPVNLSSVIAHL